jgi:hypothetical protein
MQRKSTYLSGEQAERLRRAVSDLVLAMTNNTVLIKAGYDLALKKPNLVKRVDKRVRSAHGKVKPKLVKFVAELEDVLDLPMPWAFLGCSNRREALAHLKARNHEQKTER